MLDFVSDVKNLFPVGSHRSVFLCSLLAPCMAVTLIHFCCLSGSLWIDKMFCSSLVPDCSVIPGHNSYPPCSLLINTAGKEQRQLPAVVCQCAFLPRWQCSGFYCCMLGLHDVNYLYSAEHGSLCFSTTERVVAELQVTGLSWENHNWKNVQTLSETVWV